MALPEITHRSAFITGKYRYWLERRWLDARYDAPQVVWCMLNPSTADAKTDDPTIRRCVGFTHAWGYSRMTVVNLYAYRATNPRELGPLGLAKRLGSENYDWLFYFMHNVMRDVRLVLCAWGAGRLDPLPNVVTDARRYALTFTKTGEPSHPLYLPQTLKPRLVSA
jgi:hypothetical protein